MQTCWRTIRSTGSRDRATSVEPDHLQSPLRADDVEGLHQRRTRPALRGNRAQHQAARLRLDAGEVRRDHHPSNGTARPVRQHARLRRRRLPARCTVDRLPTPSQLGATRIGGIDINIPRVRAALAAAGALAVAPAGFTVAQFTAQVQAMTGQTQHAYTTGRAPMTCASCAPNDSSPNPNAPGATSTRQCRHDLRPTHHPRPGHRPPPRRNPDTTTRPPTQTLDQHRPRLRNPTPRHADPVRSPGHRYQGGCQSIDNILSIAVRQASSGSRDAGTRPRV